MNKRKGLVFLLAASLLNLASCGVSGFFQGEYREEVDAMVTPEWFLGYASHQPFLVFDFGYDSANKTYHRKADRDQIVYGALDELECTPYSRGKEERWENCLSVNSGYGDDDDFCELLLAEDFTKISILANKGDLFSATFGNRYYQIDETKGKAVYQAALTSQEKYPDDVEF
jgi:hypothetical protein